MSRVRRPPAASTIGALRPLGLPRSVQVRADADAMPLTVARSGPHGARGPGLRVEHIEEVWRIAEAWWREAPQARTYYRVILEGGRPLTLFHDDRLGGWFEQPYSAGGRGEP